MADPTLPQNVSTSLMPSSTRAEDVEDAAPVPLNISPPDPEKAGAIADRRMKAEPGAKWKNDEVQDIPKK